ncbi:MAG: twin-arginine translocation signal domain-containing protein [Desulfobacteraceae bacterium]|nr:twin-arginine translocation signal domain-containing protein [Desulfobacteraceae bacterium]
MSKKDHKQSQSPPSGTSRRNFLKAGTAAAGAAFLNAAAKIPLASAAN